ncbi:MAG: type IV secretion system protein TraC [Pseudomonadota bacterium]|nr:type IV secretion system protein TraC [Pseudomonadota bacterium]
MSAAAALAQPRIAELLQVLAYAPDEALFLLDDQTLGFGFLCIPLPGGDQKAADRLSVMLNSEVPKGSLMQFTLWASPDIQRQVNEMRSMRALNPDPMMREMAEQRARFLEQGTLQAIDPGTGTRVRNTYLIVSAKLPLARAQPSAEEIDSARSLAMEMASVLKTAGFEPRALAAGDWVRAVSSMINPGANASWRTPETAGVDPRKVLREQVADFDTDLRVDSCGLWLGDTRVKTLSVKRYPKEGWFGMAMSYLGDYLSGTRGIKETCLVSATIHFPDRQAKKSAMETKRQWATNQAYGPMVKFVPILAAKKEGLDALVETFDDGERPVELYLSMALYAEDENACKAAAANARTYWGEQGFQLLEDRFFCLPFFLNLLPLGADPVAIRDTFRYRTMAPRHAVTLLPIFSDWKGTGTPVMTLISRGGDLMNVSLYDSGSNYNTCICAQSGSGKSYLANEIVSSYLGIGGKAWVIDVGRSYEKLCDVLGGDFVQFGSDSEICLNPFPLIQDYGEEEDMLAGMVAAMAAPTQSLSDYQMAGLKRTMKSVWDRRGHDMTIDEVATALEAEDDRRINDIGEQLYAFTSRGEYGRYFNGPNNVAFRNRFTVLELEELKGRKHLQQVVLLQLIYQIQQDTYLGDRSQKKVVLIDEAWELIAQRAGPGSDGSEVARFMETAARRYRKYGASQVVVTQSVLDLYQTSTGRAIAENSANMYLLGQKVDAINTLRKDGLLPLNEGGYELLKTVHTIPGAYSEIFFLTERGAGIGRLIVEPWKGLLYSTRAEDVAAIDARRSAGLGVREAIEAVMRERGMSHG